MSSEPELLDIRSDEEDDSPNWLDKLWAEEGWDEEDDPTDMAAVDQILNLVEKPKDGESDDDFVILEGDPDKAIEVKEDKGGGKDDSDELLIVAEKGQVACRDFPHSRHLCASFPFNATSHEKHCGLCHCYVCDSPAPCIHWGNGGSPSDHCHATEAEVWKIQRKSIKITLVKRKPCDPKVQMASLPIQNTAPLSFQVPVPLLTQASLTNILHPCTASSVGSAYGPCHSRQQQPAFTCLRQHQQPTVTDPRYQQQTAVTDPRQQRQPAVTHPRQHQQPAVTDPRQHQQPAVTDPRQHQRPAVTDPRQHQQPAVTDPRYYQQLAVTDPRYYQQPAVTDPRYYQQPAVTDPSYYQPPAVTYPRHHQQPDVTDPRHHQQPDVTDPRHHQQPAVTDPRYHQQPPFIFSHLHRLGQHMTRSRPSVSETQDLHKGRNGVDALAHSSVQSHAKFKRAGHPGSGFINMGRNRPQDMASDQTLSSLLQLSHYSSEESHSSQQQALTSHSHDTLVTSHQRSQSMPSASQRSHLLPLSIPISRKLPTSIYSETQYMPVTPEEYVRTLQGVPPGVTSELGISDSDCKGMATFQPFIVPSLHSSVGGQVPYHIDSYQGMVHYPHLGPNATLSYPLQFDNSWSNRTTGFDFMGLGEGVQPLELASGLTQFESILSSVKQEDDVFSAPVLYDFIRNWS